MRYLLYELRRANHTHTHTHTQKRRNGKVKMLAAIPKKNAYGARVVYVQVET